MQWMGIAPLHPSYALRRANVRPMTGSAKQSIEPRRHCERSEAIHKAPKKKERMDCFASLAMTSKHTFASSRREAPEALVKLFAP
jgi:hypothetical protein